ncbi:YtxH domain-containing protein [Pinisolibacter sp.]|uniref:YtxH domain-containing protein n=1 Tax=Pinisolibacter sp. TaxID=2172024 RepID=UPI002FDE7929
MARKTKKWKKLQRRLKAFEGRLGGNGNGWGAGMNGGNGLLAGLGGLLPSRRSEQLLLGLALGAAGAWVLSDAELRGKIMKGAMRLYAGMAAGLEEMKEQAEDLKAELAAEQAGPIA